MDLINHGVLQDGAVWPISVARWVVGVTLLLSGGSKLRDLKGFARGISGLPHLGRAPRQSTRYHAAVR